VPLWRRLLLAVLLTLPMAAAALDSPRSSPTEAPRARPAPQTRPHGRRLEVPPGRVHVDDGDTIVVHWSESDREIVRVLGVDAPETRHVDHDIPFAQPFGAEARAFAQGVFAAAARVEILRAPTLDGYGRTLAYVFVTDRNYSVLLLDAGLAEENVSHFGDNGLPAEAEAVRAAARRARPVPFEPPHAFRARMREWSRAEKARGRYPPPD
jgi:endonuclease YncB( thermonuclease family)